MLIRPGSFARHAEETTMLSLRSLIPATRAGRLTAAALGVATLLGFSIADAEARSGRGGSLGSRGGKTFSAPPPTTTAPAPVAPIQKSITSPTKAAPAAGAATAASQTAAQAAKPNMMRNLLLGGLLGAGLASMFGLGGGLAAVLGFLLQAALIAAIVFLVVGFIRSRMQPVPAAAYSGRPGTQQQSNAEFRANSVGGGATAVPPLAIQGADFDAFERLLGEIQSAYGREDIDALGDRVTPEMLSYFAGEIEDNKRNGVANRISGVKLLQGDLSESWREPTGEYATVAMRYAITDEIVDRKTGGRREGGASEVTEIWTFARRTGEDASKWHLSAIQQVAA
jgi:predicted lipid-binding transport protein (Tim44 family)